MQTQVYAVFRKYISPPLSLACLFTLSMLWAASAMADSDIVAVSNHNKNAGFQVVKVDFANRRPVVLEVSPTAASILQTRLFALTQTCENLNLKISSENVVLVVDTYNTFGELRPFDVEDPFSETLLVSSENIPVSAGTYSISISPDVSDFGINSLKFQRPLTDSTSCQIEILMNFQSISSLDHEDRNLAQQLLAVQSRLRSMELFGLIDLNNFSIAQIEPLNPTSIADYWQSYCELQRTMSRTRSFAQLEPMSTDNGTAQSKNWNTLMRLNIARHIAVREGATWLNIEGLDAMFCDRDSLVSEDRPSFKEIKTIAADKNAIRFLVDASLEDDDKFVSSGSASKVLTDKLFALETAIADALDVDVRSVAFHFRQDGCSGFAVFSTPINALEDPWMCLTSGSTSVSVSPRGSYWGNAHSTSVSVSDSGSGTLSAVVAHLLPSHGKITWLTQEPSTVRLRISNVKGWVSPMSRYWERVYLTAVLVTEEKERELLVIVDGAVASGAGEIPPSEDQFVKSMDNLAGYSLSDFSQSMAQQIKSGLE